MGLLILVGKNSKSFATDFEILSFKIFETIFKYFGYQTINRYAKRTTKWYRDHFITGIRRRKHAN